MNTSKTPKTRETTKTFLGGKLVISQRVTEWDGESLYETSIRSSQASVAFPDFPEISQLPDGVRNFKETQSGFSLVTKNKEIHAATFGEFLQKLFRAFVSRS